MSESDAQLIEAAVQVRERAYAPYSHFAVGAALRGRSGRIYTGANVENASFPLTICAERAALFKAVSEGEREFDAIAVVTSSGATPCGACRQVLAEFAPRLRVIVADLDAHSSVFSIAELLPHGFDARKLSDK